MKILNSVAWIIFLVATFAIAGCISRDGFQPLPAMFQTWAKEDASPDDVKQALLDCGYANPYSGFEGYVRVSNEVLAAAEQCMKRKGYRYLLGGGRTRCDRKDNADLAACQKK